MASVSYNYYVGNGVKKDYEFTQELNTKATVYGLVNQVETAGTWDSGTGFFTFTVAPASGAQIWIARRTSNDTAVATYPNKSYINSENLDADFRQSLMQVQEAQFDNDQAVLLNAGAPGYAAAAAASAAAAAASEVATAADLVLTNADVVLTNADVVTTGLDVTYSQEWATKAEDSLISVAAGGDGATDYSALHWAAKAAATTTTLAVLKAGSTMDSGADLTFAGGGEVLGLPATPAATGAASKEYVNNQDALKYNTTGGNITGQINHAYYDPIHRWLNTGAGTDENNWDISVYRDSWNLRTVNDALSASSNIMSVSRSGYTVTGIYFNAPVTGTNAPTGADHLTRKDYVDALVGNISINGKITGTGTIINVSDPGTWSVSKIAVGQYRIVHPMGTANLSFVGSCIGSKLNIYHATPTSTTIDVFLCDMAGTLTDGALSFHTGVIV